MGYIDITGRFHPTGTYYEGSQQPGDPTSAPPPTPGMLWLNGAWVMPTSAASWPTLMAWARKNVDAAALFALQKSMYGALAFDAAALGDWDGAGTYYGDLKADMVASPDAYTPATSDTLTAIAGQFAACGVPITP